MTSLFAAMLWALILAVDSAVPGEPERVLYQVNIHATGCALDVWRSTWETALAVRLRESGFTPIVSGLTSPPVLAPTAPVAYLDVDCVLADRGLVFLWGITLFEPVDSRLLGRTVRAAVYWRRPTRLWVGDEAELSRILLEGLNGATFR